MYQLRDYQQVLINQTLKAFKDYKKVLMTAPTGAGKTILADYLISRVFTDKKIFFVCNREELVKQSAQKFSCDVGIVKAGMESEMDLTKRVQIIMINTYHARKDRLELPNPDLVIIDEAHQFDFKKKMTAGLIESIGHDARYLGMTATPMSERGYALEGWDTIIDDVQIRDLQKSGWLVKEKWFVGDEVDLSNVSVKNGDYQTGELSEEMRKATVIENVYENYEKLSKNKKTMVFATDIAHAEELNKAFTRKGYEPFVIHSKMENPEMRPEFIERFTNKKDGILINVLALTTGFDEPSVESLIIARPTKSLRLAIQMVGRGLRTVLDDNFKPDLSLKNECLILDCGNLVNTFGGLPTARRDFLEQEFQVNSDDQISGKKCGGCGLWNESGRYCKDCGFDMHQKICKACGALNKPEDNYCDACKHPLSGVLNSLNKVKSELKEFVDVQEILFEAKPTFDNLEKLFAFAERKSRHKRKTEKGYSEKAYNYMLNEFEYNIEKGVKAEQIKKKLITIVRKGYNPFAIRYMFDDWYKLESVKVKDNYQTSFVKVKKSKRV